MRRVPNLWFGDADAPSFTVIADRDGNRGVVCVDLSAANKD